MASLIFLFLLCTKLFLLKVYIKLLSSLIPQLQINILTHICGLCRAVFLFCVSWLDLWNRAECPGPEAGSELLSLTSCPHLAVWLFKLFNTPLSSLFQRILSMCQGGTRRRTKWRSGLHHCCYCGSDDKGRGSLETPDVESAKGWLLLFEYSLSPCQLVFHQLSSRKGVFSPTVLVDLDVIGYLHSLGPVEK